MPAFIFQSIFAIFPFIELKEICLCFNGWLFCFECYRKLNYQIWKNQCLMRLLSFVVLFNQQSALWCRQSKKLWFNDQVNHFIHYLLTLTWSLWVHNWSFIILLHTSLCNSYCPVFGYYGSRTYLSALAKLLLLKPLIHLWVSGPHKECCLVRYSHSGGNFVQSRGLTSLRWGIQFSHDDRRTWLIEHIW